MKLLGVILAGLLVLIQYPLWLGHGSWLRVWELDRQLGLQQEVNAGKRMRNEGLEAEASDLRNGTQALEERARYELGMLKRDEIFVQFNPGSGPEPGVPPGAVPATSSGLAPGVARPSPMQPAHSGPRGGTVAAGMPRGREGVAAGGP